MRRPVVLVTGVDPDAMATAMVGLQFDLPRAVAVHHRIDVDRQVLTRTVSDLSGVVEHVETELEHACVACAIREDIVPTLERLARDGRWESVVALLPVGATAPQVCSVLSRDPRLARVVRVSAVMVAVRSELVVSDVLGDDLLAERGHHTSHEDRRGVGEVLASMVEFADVVVADDVLRPPAFELLRALARPDVLVQADGPHHLAAQELLGHLHRHGCIRVARGPALAVRFPSRAAAGLPGVPRRRVTPLPRVFLAPDPPRTGARVGRSRRAAQHR
jgi:hypothetical protein